jgi:ABC-type Fe3+/spermidine/putrescine transport system ATPase subunit
MSDRIVVMHKGEVEQIGTPSEIYEQPNSLFVASFIGYINMIDGKVKDKVNRSFIINTYLGDFENSNESLEYISKEDNITVIIRPEAATIEHEYSKRAKNCFKGKIQNYTYIGSLVRYRIKVEKLPHPFILDVSNPEGKGIHNVGETVTVKIPLSFHCIKK